MLRTILLWALCLPAVALLWAVRLLFFRGE